MAAKAGVRGAEGLLGKEVIVKVFPNVVLSLEE